MKVGVCVAVCPLKLIMEHHTSGMSYRSVTMAVQACLLPCWYKINQFFIKNTAEINSHSRSFQWTSLADARGCLGNTQRRLLQETFISQTRLQACFLSLIPSTTAERLESLAAVWKAPFKLSFGGSGGVAWKHWGVAKMAAVSEGMKTVTLCYQSFQSVPCPCGVFALCTPLLTNRSCRRTTLAAARTSLCTCELRACETDAWR